MTLKKDDYQRMCMIESHFAERVIEMLNKHPTWSARCNLESIDWELHLVTVRYEYRGPYTDGSYNPDWIYLKAEWLFSDEAYEKGLKEEADKKEQLRLDREKTDIEYKRQRDLEKYKELKKRFEGEDCGQHHR